MIQPGMKVIYRVNLGYGDSEDIHLLNVRVLSLQKNLDRAKIEVHPGSKFAFNIFCSTKDLYNL